MRNNLIAQRYAKAVLLNIKSEEFDDLRADIKQMMEIFHQDTDYLKSLDSMLYPFQKRLNAALEITKGLSKQELWKNLFEILIKKNRFSLIDDILRVLDADILHLENKVHVKLTIAHKHSAEVMQQIENKIRDILNKDIEIEIRKNPEILGGFLAETESFLIDGSVKHNLVKLINIKKN
ncbi:MAG: ATP synthase F1 subunit delta [Candidatus Cloacimonetes bacterium]|nr:ATP synthase F1 subunit delta [Candidatus Cloacimonadota bacterium]MCF7813845.1 ATP synthase F1 subunit delta [Candidatus Cloacimonadota bacterium]MCF7868283.1 ATP synthase F1 subunit delta [Candidatus Cloacimonadota bacterium]MCF7883743.1 ATP synthase F1 subunit delta [Candidatus Cloacimonadota bacterium]